MRFLRVVCRLHPVTRVLVLIAMPIGGIAALGSGFALGEWCLAVVGTLALVLNDWWGTRPRRKEVADVAPLRHDS